MVSAQARQSLLRLLRLLFPHTALPNGPYERAADALLAEAAASPVFGALVVQGLADLDAAAPFAELDEPGALYAVELVADTPFFHEVRRRAVFVLYSDAEVWKLIGYEGPSFDKGGYLHRGFDDLDWLPDPPL